MEERERGMMRAKEVIRDGKFSIMLTTNLVAGVDRQADCLSILAFCALFAALIGGMGQPLGSSSDF